MKRLVLIVPAVLLLFFVALPTTAQNADCDALIIQAHDLLEQAKDAAATGDIVTAKALASGVKPLLSPCVTNPECAVLSQVNPLLLQVQTSTDAKSLETLIESVQALLAACSDSADPALTQFTGEMVSFTYPTTWQYASLYDSDDGVTGELVMLSPQPINLGDFDVNDDLALLADNESLVAALSRDMVVGIIGIQGVGDLGEPSQLLEDLIADYDLPILQREALRRITVNDMPGAAITGVLEGQGALAELRIGGYAAIASTPNQAVLFFAGAPESIFNANLPLIEQMLLTVTFQNTIPAVSGTTVPTVELDLPEGAATIYAGIEQGTSEFGFPRLGSADAPIVVEIYSSFGCPHCKVFHNDHILPLREEIQNGQIQVIFEPISFIANNEENFALKSARAAVCAMEQGHFWELHYIAFDWQGQHSIEDDDLTAIAQLLGMDAAAFLACYNSNQADGIIRLAEQRFQEHGFNSTPRVLVNGEAVANNDDFPAVIADLLGE